jgi:hypothetical protein
MELEVMSEDWRGFVGDSTWEPRYLLDDCFEVLSELLLDWRDLSFLSVFNVVTCNTSS